MQDMAANTPDLTNAEKARWLQKLDRATAAHAKTRQRLDEIVAGARQAGVSLTAISEHSPYSREWARRIADRINAAPPESDEADAE
jgi:hypothetical protein